jgi:hypothetical protein
MSEARELIVEVMREVQGVAKRDRNVAQNFDFRGIDAVVNAIGPALRKHGGFIVPSVMDYKNDTATTAKGSAMNVVRLVVEFAVHGTEGEPVTGVVAAEAFDSGDKATAKAMSVAYRTFMLQTFCLPTDEPDPDSFSYEATTGTDWASAIEGLDTVEAARALWKQASTARAPKAITDAITAKADALGKSA